MAKIHKLELYIVDMNDMYRDEDVICSIKNSVDCECKIALYDNKVFEWNDDLKINCSNARIKDYKEYFINKMHK